MIPIYPNCFYIESLQYQIQYSSTSKLFTEYSSCQAAYDAGLRKDGVYYITNAGYHYCVLSNSLQCTNGGYTLVMRTDGSLVCLCFIVNTEYPFNVNISLLTEICIFR